MLKVTEKNRKDFNSDGSALIHKLIYNRFRMKKNSLITLVGNSGEGKSTNALSIATIIDPKFNPEEQVIYEPTQILEKIKNAAENKYKVLIMDEAHTSINSNTYMSLINMAISTVTATFRELHQIALIIVCPNISWIDKRMREISNFYGVSGSKLKDGRPYYYLHCFEIGFNYYDLRNQYPYLKKIYFSEEDGRVYILDEFEMKEPPEEIRKKYSEISRKYKKNVLEEKLRAVSEQAQREMELGIKKASDPTKIADMILGNKNYYKALIYKTKDGRLNLRKTDIVKLFELNPLEFIELQGIIMDKLEKGL